MNSNNLKTRVLHSETLDPWLNLATEDWIFRDMEPDGHILYLWQNSETVVIGRYQNPWIECRLDLMREEGVKLARRQSGGGAVYHDRGNLNFTFMSGIDDYNKERNFEIILTALSGFGIEAEVSGRNDILAEGRKISGSAFKLTRDRAFHHGTLLVDVDLGRLTSYLNPDQRKLSSKGIKSVKSRVANLTEFNPQLETGILSEGITEAFFSRLGRGAEETMDLLSLDKIPRLVDYYQLMKSEHWLYQKSPDFTHRIERRFIWGGIEINIDVHHAEIADIVIFTDSLFPEMIKILTVQLKGEPYSRSSVDAAADYLRKRNPDWTDCVDDISAVLIEEIRGAGPVPA
ncbi:MAG: lipoate--protein ligase [Spirochaetales bacterium]|nr:lipoate--protein ligase [Spirochaetales bacterium]